MEKQRDLSMDNIRACLIFLVVLGHLLEIGPDYPGKEMLYLSVYSFHMPAFMFLSGWFSRFRPMRTVWCVLWPYALFQPAYILSYNALYGLTLPVQYTTPNWLLWYLLALAVMQLLIPLYDRPTGWGRGAVLAGAVALALGAGYVDRIGYELSLSRFLVYQPWFVLGFYLGTGKIPRRRGGLLGWVSLGLWAVCLWALVSLGATRQMFYAAYPYSALGYGPGIRGLSMLAALGAIGALMELLRPLLDRKVPLFTAAGQNTLSVYLLHGFVVRLIGKYIPGLGGYLSASILTALALILVLGSPPVGKAMGFVLSDRWWIWLKERIKE